MCVHPLRDQCLLTGVDLSCPLKGQPLLPGVTVCPSGWTSVWVDVCLSGWMCVHSLRGQHLLTGVDLCFPLRGLPLLPGVARCPSEWTCPHPLRGPPRPAWTRRGCPWLADPPCILPAPAPPPRGPACTPCGQSAGSPQCPPLCAPSAGPHAGI